MAGRYQRGRSPASGNSQQSYMHRALCRARARPPSITACVGTWNVAAHYPPVDRLCDAGVDRPVLIAGVLGAVAAAHLRELCSLRFLVVPAAPQRLLLWHAHRPNTLPPGVSSGSRTDLTRSRRAFPSPRRTDLTRSRRSFPDWHKKLVLGRLSDGIEGEGGRDGHPFEHLRACS